MSNIRYALEEDLNAVRDLWKYSFADDESFVSYYFGKRYSPNYNLIAYEDDLLASLQRNPYKIKIRGNNRLFHTCIKLKIETLTIPGTDSGKIILKNT